MRSITLTATALCLMLTISPSLAKEKKHDKPMDPQAMMELWKQAATPGEPHKLFATLAGSWTTATKEWMEPGKPPMESTGTAESRMLLDGRFLHQEFHGQMMGQPFTGMSIDAYDNIRKKYVTIWVDTRGTGVFIMEGTGSADGKTITLRGSHAEPGGGTMTHRAIWKILDANHQLVEMYGAHHGQKEMKMMEITYTRKE
ncbi:MAG: DUF1579 domain-containing protein [Nitrospira sp.]|nr:DUF1579 domain-containing protein [Nitrospira sp.]MDH5194380.1 DUF1579 domain-containing protein [Nitrospira sp.]